jgi:hypothetical protein
VAHLSYSHSWYKSISATTCWLVGNNYPVLTGQGYVYPEYVSDNINEGISPVEVEAIVNKASEVIEGDILGIVRLQNYQKWRYLLFFIALWLCGFIVPALFSFTADGAFSALVILIILLIAHGWLVVTRIRARSLFGQMSRRVNEELNHERNRLRTCTVKTNGFLLIFELNKEYNMEMARLKATQELKDNTATAIPISVG